MKFGIDEAGAHEIAIEAEEPRIVNKLLEEQGILHR